MERKEAYIGISAYLFNVLAEIARRLVAPCLLYLREVGYLFAYGYVLREIVAAFEELLYIAFVLLMMSGFDADRVVVLSDNEVNGRSWMTYDYGYKAIQSKLDQYRTHVGHDVWCHAIDLQGYGTQQFIGAKVNIMGGWSEQVLRFVAQAEQGLGGLVDEIEAIEL